MREALLVAAALAALAAGVRAGVRGGARGVALAAVGTVATLAAFAAGAYAPWDAPARTLVLVYAGALLAKLAALGRARRRPGFARGLAYLAVYPGLSADLAFVRDPRPRRRAGAATALAGTFEMAGACLVATLAARAGVFAAGAWPAAWARMASLMFLLDGAFRLGRGALAAGGFRAEVLSRAPWAAADLADFWGRRWNLLVARTLGTEVYGPLRRGVGRVAATLAAFLVSGLYHEALFTLPVPHEVGGHTAFFLLHGAAILTTQGPALRGRPGLARAVGWGIFLATAPLFFGGPYPAAAPLERVFG